VDVIDLNLPKEMGDLDVDIEEVPSITCFFTLPSVMPRVTKKHQDPIFDFTKSIMLTSDDYMKAAADLK